MAITTYAELQTAVLDFIVRTGQTANAPDWIALAEARLNRELGPVETDATLTGTASSRTIDISALSIVEPVGLWLAESGYDEIEVIQAPDGSFPYGVTTGKPTRYAIDGANINFSCPLDAAYPFRFRYRQRFALSGSVTTNWLLTYHPDAYVAASIVWGHAYNVNFEAAAPWEGVLDEAIPSIRRTIRRMKGRGRLMVDPALMAAGSSMTESEWTGAR